MSKKSRGAKEQAASLFEEGKGYKAVATQLDISVDTAKSWEYAFRAVGREGLLARHSSAQFAFDIKMAAVRDHIEGNLNMVEIMVKYRIPNKMMLKHWICVYKEKGEEGLRGFGHGRSMRRSADRSAADEEETQDLS